MSKHIYTIDLPLTRARADVYDEQYEDNQFIEVLVDIEDFSTGWDVDILEVTEIISTSEVLRDGTLVELDENDMDIVNDQLCDEIVQHLCESDYYPEAPEYDR